MNLRERGRHTPSMVRSPGRRFKEPSNRADLTQEGVHEAFGVEGGEVVDGFAHTDVDHGELEGLGDGEDDAAFGGRVELGEDDAVGLHAFGEFLRLHERCLLYTSDAADE